MINKKIIWYKNIWIYIIIVIIGIIIKLSYKKTIEYFNINDYLKAQNDSLSRKIVIQDSIYKVLDFQKAKVVIIREKINTEYETKRIKELKEELRNLRNAKTDTLPDDNPIKLLEYFNNVIK
jgi:hypothetical protein